MEKQKMEHKDDLNPKEVFDLFRAANTLEPIDYNETEAWEKIRKFTLKDKKHHFYWIRYAAIVLLLFSVGGMVRYFYPVKENNKPLLKTENDRPAKKQVELTLANGKSIALQKRTILQQPSAELRVDTISGELQYLHQESQTDTGICYNILSVPRGGEYTLVLSDGTKVWINAASSIRYPVTFAAHQREVFLEGEAYFQVTPNKNAPFRIHTAGEDIQVLGTSFNVNAYSDEAFRHVTLVEGRLAIEKNGERIAVLKPSWQYRVEQTTEISELIPVNSDFFTSWREGKINFKNTRLEEIMNRLQRWYDYEIFYENQEVKNLKFRGTINKYNSIQVVLNYLEQTTDIRFEIQKNTILVKKKN